MLALALIAATLRWWEGLPVLRGIGRALETPQPHLAALALLGAAALAGLGRRRLAALAAAGGAIGLAAAASGWWATAAAPLPERGSGQGELTVLWFNLYGRNAVPPDRLIAALAESPADLVILAEADALQPHLTALAAAFPHQAGCRERRCEVLALSRRAPLGMEFRTMGHDRPERLVRVTLDLPGDGPLAVLGIHMVKPWYSPYSEIDEWSAVQALRETPGPLAMVGDFNAAPWSGRVTRLAAACGLGHARQTPATWPAWAGPLGLPVDLALAGSGTAVTAVTPWGAGLGSNHRGLLLRLAMTGKGQGGCAPSVP